MHSGQVFSSGRDMAPLPWERTTNSADRRRRQRGQATAPVDPPARSSRPNHEVFMDAIRRRVCYERALLATGLSPRDRGRIEVHLNKARETIRQCMKVFGKQQVSREIISSYEDQARADAASSSDH